jgi:hypothetical protein
LEVAGRQVLAIKNIDYFILPFNAKGRINKKEWENGMRLGLELLPPYSVRNVPKRSLMLGIALPRGVMNTSSGGSRVEK